MNQSNYVGIIDSCVASKLEVVQLGASACGATALVNTLLALQIITVDECKSINWNVCTVRSRDLDCPLPQYLASRSIAGCTGFELINSMNKLLQESGNTGKLVGEFIPFEHVSSLGIRLVEYLSNLFNEGNVAVVGTFNLQIVGNDAWHHQLIYGVDTSARTIYCMNNLCEYPESLAEQFMSTSSVLCIRREDIISRLDRLGGDEEIYNRPLWTQFKVKEQIQAMKSNEQMKYVIIPANYVGGMCVFRKLDTITNNS